MATFPLVTFRTLYPAFAAVPDATVLAVSEQALCFVDLSACDCSEQGWMLATAHMLALRDSATAGGAPSGALASATVGSVSVSFQAPPTGGSGYRFWLTSTPYGLQLSALLSRCAAGVLYVGGAPERAAFRRVGGGFPNRGRVL